MPTQRFDVNTKGTDLVQQLSSHIAKKTILVTGVSANGIGAFFVESISALEHGPKLLILAGRSLSKLEETQANLRSINSSVATRPLVIDLQSFDSVRTAAKEVIAQAEHIDVLVCNAGIMAPPYSKTVDGFESNFQTNHLSHFLFTNLIMEKLLDAADPRVVVVSSDGYRLGHVRYHDYSFHDGESYNPWVAYGQSKSANHLFARELATRLGPRGLTAVAIHPGVIASSGLSNHLGDDAWSGLQALDRQVGSPQAWGRFEVIGQDQGIATHVFASFSPEVKSFNGGYLEKLYQIPYPDEEIHPWAIGELEQKKCWKLSEKLVGQVFE